MTVLAIAAGGALLLPALMALLTTGGIGYGMWKEGRQGKREERNARRQISLERQAALLERLLTRKDVEAKRQQLAENLKLLRQLKAEDRTKELNERIAAIRGQQSEGELGLMMQSLQGGAATNEAMQAGARNINLPLSWYLNQM